MKNSISPMNPLMPRLMMAALAGMLTAGAAAQAPAASASASAMALPASPAPAAPALPALPALPMLDDFDFDFDMAPMAMLDMPLELPMSSPMGLAFQEPMPAPMPMPQPTTHVSVRVKATPIVHDANYDAGLKAMEESRWQDAISAFDKSAAQSPTNAPAVLYWRAYNLQKLGRKDDAKAACNLLIADKDGGVWKQECLVLDAQAGANPKEVERMMEQISRLSVNRSDYDTRVYEIDRDYAKSASAYMYKREPLDPNDELKLIALEGLMRQEPEKALPVLHDMIFSKKPSELRRRALFLLARSKDPQAQAMLVQAAKENSDPELQRMAVQSLSTKGKTSAADLKAIYQSATDNGVKRAALTGLFGANDAPTLVDLARNEKDLSLKKEIVSQLAIMKDPAATAYMEELLK